MRSQKLTAGALQVFVQISRFATNESYYPNYVLLRLLLDTGYTSDLIMVARRGLEQIWRPGRRYSKDGVMVLDLQPQTQV